jgi:hypothetical protein
MFFNRGRWPQQSSVRPSATVYTGRVRAILLIIGLLPAALLAAEQGVPLTLYAAEDIALDQEPGQVAMLARADAFDDESIAASQLPDPVMRMGRANYPIESGGFTTEGMTQLQMGIRQAFPRRASLDAGKRRFESLALEMRGAADGRSRDVLQAVRQAWLDLYYWQQAGEITEGRRDQQDLLRAQLELSRIEERLIEIERQRAEAAATLSQWIGDAARRPAAGALPQWETLPPLEALRTELSRHPALAAADARIDASQARVDLADSAFKPGWALDLGYGHRNGHLPSGEPRSDFISLTVSMDLPFFQENRQDRQLSAALSERRAARESRTEVERRLESLLARELSRWQELSRRLALYDERILAQSRDHAEAALVAYQSDATDFADVMRGYINDLNTRVDYVRLQTDRAKSYAVLSNLGGIPR